MAGITRRNFLASIAGAFTGAAVTKSMSLLPFFAPEPEKKYENENPVDVRDAQLLVHEYGIIDPTADEDKLPPEELLKRDTINSLKLVREIDGDNIKMFGIGGATGSTTSAVLGFATDAVFGEDEDPEVLSTGALTNVAVSTAAATALTNSIAKRFELMQTASKSRLSSKYGMSDEKAATFIDRGKIYPLVASFIGAAIGALVSRPTRTVVQCAQGSEQADKPGIDLD